MFGLSYSTRKEYNWNVPYQWNNPEVAHIYTSIDVSHLVQLRDFRCIVCDEREVWIFPKQLRRVGSLVCPYCSSLLNYLVSTFPAGVVESLAISVKSNSLIVWNVSIES